jgi:hypothetical protein
VFFTDYVKAFYLVLQEKLWETMTEKGLPTHLIRTVKSIYQNTTIIQRKDRMNDNTQSLTRLPFVTGTLTESSKIGCR